MPFVSFPPAVHSITTRITFCITIIRGFIWLYVCDVGRSGVGVQRRVIHCTCRQVEGVRTDKCISNWRQCACDTCMSVWLGNNSHMCGSGQQQMCQNNWVRWISWMKRVYRGIEKCLMGEIGQSLDGVSGACGQILRKILGRGKKKRFVHQKGRRRPCLRWLDCTRTGTTKGQMQGEDWRALARDRVQPEEGHAQGAMIVVATIKAPTLNHGHTWLYMRKRERDVTLVKK